MADADEASASNPPNASVSGLVATLVPALLVALVYFTIFLILRKTHKRWYAPRTYLGTIREQYVLCASVLIII